jgi:hypothetical protein
MPLRRTLLDRRHCFRFPTNLGTSFVPASENVSHSALVQNISRRGVKLLVDHRWDRQLQRLRQRHGQLQRLGRERAAERAGDVVGRVGQCTRC